MEPTTTTVSEDSEGLRARKKRETSRRIAETALELFLKQGYEDTTLDEIAAASGIARRTFFYYFKSKEAILLAFIDNGFVPSFPPLLHAQPHNLSPFVAVRNSLIALYSAHDTKKALVLYDLLESTEVLKARLQTVPIEMEDCIYAALCERYPEPSMRAGHRMIAAVAVAAVRIAKGTWRKDQGRQPVSDYLQDSFDVLEQAI